MAFNFNYLYENRVILKVTASDVHCKCGIMSKTAPGRVVDTNADH